ncbi:hypothetical protein SLEP1_g17401 [Rubroshorea leprosula]|uniref:Uncharacterized protein n=1 Tax=Rubroshorea leprosula TaxID=152421 RepID=A0AAV5J385_9ROSI|nr:hypothetical protein SLEP1_g17401 [Rubroshorea leprosula]
MLGQPCSRKWSMFKLQIPKIIGRGKAVHWQMCFVVLTTVTKHWALELFQHPTEN